MAPRGSSQADGAVLIVCPDLADAKLNELFGAPSTQKITIRYAP